MHGYDHKKIEEKWRQEWQKQNLYTVPTQSTKKKYYCLIEFPYPSGEGLHVGHVRSYTALDVIARKRRMEGYDVLYPIGWDAFGLPAENYAIKTNVHPSITTKKNIDNYRRQLTSLGFSFDWSREINTTDPAYYKWTQWIFLQFFKKGLAYKAKMPVNWCFSCKTGLANEEVIDGNCERCGGKTEKREREQWMLAITKYAERLADDLDLIEVDERIKVQQRNWIGKSIGAEITFRVVGTKEEIKVFTTRPDTLFGSTYLVLAPDHPLVHVLAGLVKNKEAVLAYCAAAALRKDSERSNEDHDKTGVPLQGIEACNPANGEKIPIWIADYVLASYGTGAIMAVPAHDKRDFEFAQTYHLPIRIVVCPHYPKTTCPILDAAYEGNGHLVDSGSYTGKQNEEAGREMTRDVGGVEKTVYKLRDWVFSRQRYWGEPIPIILCPTCGPVAVPESQLPVELPFCENFKPMEDGASPLSGIASFVETTCPLCQGPARRETDTMPNWAGSSWYYLRYVDPHNTRTFADSEALTRWIPVDWYNGGMEHTTLHLLYSRFWHKFLFDLNLVPSKEPYAKRTSHGLILAEQGGKMSKSKGNVVNPDDIVERFGADTLRIYELFMGPFEQAIEWNTGNIAGSRRFLEKVIRLREKVEESESIEASAELLSHAHQAIKKVSADIENMRFNTAVSALMIFANTLEDTPQIPQEIFEIFLQLLAPSAPHLAEELWSSLRHTTSIHRSVWPVCDEQKIMRENVIIAVQVNGKLRGTLSVPVGAEESMVREQVLELPAVKRMMGDHSVKKTVFIKNKLINMVL